MEEDNRPAAPRPRCPTSVTPALAPPARHAPSSDVPARTRVGAVRSTGESLREYGRGVAGGLLFSLPLLYTMEVWQGGFTMPPERQLAYVILALVLLLGYNRYAGLHPDVTWAEVAIDSVEEMGIGLLLSALVLLLIGRIGPGQDAGEVVGRIVVEAVTVAIGVSVGTAQLGGDDNDSKAEMTDKDRVSFGGQLTLAICGAVLFAANVAPTEEIVVIGVELAGYQLAATGLVTLGLGALILFYSDFRGARHWVRVEGFGGVLRGAVITYAVGLLTSAAILWLFGRFDGVGVSVMLGQTVALAVASTIGASAGRLLLQGAGHE
ncbi:MAG: TIGR02587 family membrane protein [Gemmatimonadales bacterium]